MTLTNEDVADILALLDSLPYDSLDVQTPRFRLTLRRAPDGGWTQESQVLADPAPLTAATDGASATNARPPDVSGTSPASPASPQPSPAPQPSQSAQPSQSSQPDGSGTPAADGLVSVAAPLPGTFYRAPRPGAEPFVEAGDPVGADTVVAILETMKLMNSVHAGTAGHVARICLANGEFAPAGTTLMLIEPGK